MGGRLRRLLFLPSTLLLILRDLVEGVGHVLVRMLAADIRRLLLVLLILELAIAGLINHVFTVTLRGLKNFFDHLTLPVRLGRGSSDRGLLLGGGRTGCIIVELFLTGLVDSLLGRGCLSNGRFAHVGALVDLCLSIDALAILNINVANTLFKRLPKAALILQLLLHRVL